MLGEMDVDIARLRRLSSLSTARSYSGVRVTAGLGVRVRCCVVMLASKASMLTLIVSAFSSFAIFSSSSMLIFFISDRLRTGASLLLALYASSIFSTCFLFASVLANLTTSKTRRKVRT